MCNSSKRIPTQRRQHESKADCLARSQRARQPGPARQPGHLRAPLDFLRVRPEQLPSATHLSRRVGTLSASATAVPARTPPAARACWPVTHLASLVALLVASISISIDCKPRRPFSLQPIIFFCHVDVGSWARPWNKHIMISSAKQCGARALGKEPASPCSS